MATPGYNVSLTIRQEFIAYFTAAQLVAIVLGEDETGVVEEHGVTPKDATRILRLRSMDVNGKRSRVRQANRALATIRAAA